MTTTIMRNGMLSRDRLIDSVSDFFNDGVTTAEEIDNITNEIIATVNKMLPGSLMWIDATSEIHADTDDSTTITTEQFEEILNSAFAVVVSCY